MTDVLRISQDSEHICPIQIEGRTSIGNIKIHKRTNEYGEKGMELIVTWWVTVCSHVEPPWDRKSEQRNQWVTGCHSRADYPHRSQNFMNKYLFLNTKNI